MKDDSGSTAIIGLLVVALLFGIAFTTVMTVTTSTVRSATTHDSEDLANVAQAALELMLKSPGVAQAGGSGWETTPDFVKQIGLTKMGKPNALDYNKVLALRGGGLNAAPNGFLDYPEAKSALSLSNVNFHLRSYPALPTLKDPAWSALRGLDVAYVGHFNVSNNAKPVIGVSVHNETTDDGYSETEVTIVYMSGPVQNAFQITLDLSTTGHTIQNLMTPLMSPGETQTITARWYDLAWPSGTKNYDLRVSVADAGTASALYDKRNHYVPLTSGGYAYELLMEPSKPYYHGVTKAKLVLDKSKADGSRYRTAVAATLTVTDPVGASLLANAPVSIPANSHTNYDVDLTGRPYGTYTAVLSAGGETVTNRFVWGSGQLDNNGYFCSPDCLKERGYIQALIANFHNVTYFTGPAPADVFRDHNEDMGPLGDLLNDTVAKPYDLLIVGSHMTSSQLQGSFPGKVLNFVQAGGTLIALGAEESDVQWMKSIFGAGIATATGGIGTPDATAAILHSPEELAYRSYEDFDRVYKIDGNDRDKFTHIIVKDASGSTEKDTLAISNPGAYGQGTVIVASYIPRLILGSAGESSDIEAKKFLHNLVAQSYRMLFIDYGPKIPDTAVVSSATRLGVVDLPQVPGSQVDVRLVLYAFR